MMSLTLSQMSKKKEISFSFFDEIDEHSQDLVLFTEEIEEEEQNNGSKNGGLYGDKLGEEGQQGLENNGTDMQQEAKGNSKKQKKTDFEIDAFDGKDQVLDNEKLVDQKMEEYEQEVNAYLEELDDKEMELAMVR